MFSRDKEREREREREEAADSVLYGRVTLTLALINSLFLAHFLLRILHFLPNQTVDWGVGVSILSSGPFFCGSRVLFCSLMMMGCVGVDFGF